MSEQDERGALVCVLCGRPWPMFANRCECGGFCTWGQAEGAEPTSWVREEGGYRPRMPGESKDED
jgi:hypothetical protein